MKMKSKRKWTRDTIGKIISFLAIVIIAGLIIKMFLFIYETWKTNRLAIGGILIIGTYLYPVLYSFFKEVKKKDKKIKKILMSENETEIAKKLEEFDFYTLPQFCAELLKQFSSLWVFIFVQIIFLQIPEFEDMRAVTTMQIYWGFIVGSVMISLCFYFIVAAHSLAISTESLSKKRHIKYVTSFKNMLEAERGE